MEFIDVDLTVLVVESVGDLHYSADIDVSQLLDQGEDLYEIAVHDGVFAVFEYGHTAAVHVEVPFTCIVGQHYVPQFYCLLKSKLLRQHQRHPPKAVILRYYLLIL